MRRQPCRAERCHRLTEVEICQHNENNGHGWSDHPWNAGLLTYDRQNKWMCSPHKPQPSPTSLMTALSWATIIPSLISPARAGPPPGSTECLPISILTAGKTSHSNLIVHSGEANEAVPRFRPADPADGGQSGSPGFPAAPCQASCSNLKLLLSCAI